MVGSYNAKVKIYHIFLSTNSSEGEMKMARKRATTNDNTRRLAALKAWVTRRANELSRKRSEAARKAWVTRRMNSR